MLETAPTPQNSWIEFTDAIELMVNHEANHEDNKSTCKSKPIQETDVPQVPETMVDILEQENIDVPRVKHWILSYLTKLFAAHETETLGEPKSTNTLEEVTAYLDAVCVKKDVNPLMFLIGCLYLKKLLPKIPTDVNLMEFMVFYTVSATIASKMNEDLYATTKKYWSMYCKYELPVHFEDFAFAERVLIDLLDWNLYISKEELKTFLLEWVTFQL